MNALSSLSDISTDLHNAFISSFADALELRDAHALAIEKKRVFKRSQHMMVQETIRAKFKRAFERVGLNVESVTLAPSFMTEASVEARKVLDKRRASRIERAANVRRLRETEAEMEKELALVGL